MTIFGRTVQNEANDGRWSKMKQSRTKILAQSRWETGIRECETDLYWQYPGPSDSKKPGIPHS
jgi:hypothetical protein